MPSSGGLPTSATLQEKVLLSLRRAEPAALALGHRYPSPSGLNCSDGLEGNDDLAYELGQKMCHSQEIADLNQFKATNESRISVLCFTTTAEKRHS